MESQTVQPNITQAVHPGMAPQGTQVSFCKKSPVKHKHNPLERVKLTDESHIVQSLSLLQLRHPTGQCKQIDGEKE